MNDLTNRYSNKMPFKNIAPLICEVHVDAQGAVAADVLMSTTGTTLIAVEGAFFGTRTWAAVDGIVCDNQAQFMQSCVNAEGVEVACIGPGVANSTRREYLYPAYGVNPLEPHCPARALESSEAQPKIVKCVAPPGYGAGRSLVIYNGNQPSSAKLVHYRAPVVTGVSMTVLPTSGVDMLTRRRVNVSWCRTSTQRPLPPTPPPFPTHLPLTLFFVTELPCHELPCSFLCQVTITGSDFGDWDAIDARCRDPVYTDISRCSSSAVCELVAITASERMCRGQVRVPLALDFLPWMLVADV